MKILHFDNEFNEELFSLLKLEYYTLSTDFWDWRFNQNEFGSPIQYGAWDDNKLVGYHIVQPVPMKIQNNVEKILFSMATITHPDYRGQGIAEKLGKQVYDKATELGYRMVIGFPNQNSKNLFFKKLNWINLGNILEFEKSIEKCNKINSRNLKIYEINNFDEKTNRIWDLNKNNYEFIVERNSDFLNWRYVMAPKCGVRIEPTTEYSCFILEEDGKPETYFVIKKYGKDNAHIVDLFGKLTEKILDEIISFSIEFCVKHKILNLSIWPDFNSTQKNLFSILENNGFTKKISDKFRGMCIFDNDLKNIMTKENNWYFSMGDCDVY